jgi:hypothetical protein
MAAKKKVTPREAERAKQKLGYQSPTSGSDKPLGAMVREAKYDARRDPMSPGKARTASRAKAIANRSDKLAKAKLTVNRANSTAKALAATKKPENIVQEITNRFRVTKREARDIVTAVGNVGAIFKDEARTGALGGVKNQLKKAGKEIGRQVSETASAATKGQKGSPSKIYTTMMGDDPASIRPRGAKTKRRA